MTINVVLVSYCLIHLKFKKMPEVHVNAAPALTNLLSLGD